MKKIIISGEERRVKPLAAFTLSLFVTGLGQVYCGSASQGIVLMLLRIVSVIAVPCYAFLNPGENLLTEISIALSAFLVITISSPVEALIRASLSGKVRKQRYNSSTFYISYALVTAIFTALSISVFFAVFGIYMIRSSHRPLFLEGDILAVNKVNIRYRAGETVSVRNGIPVRVIGLPGETVSFSGGRFSINGSELQRSIFTENELLRSPLWDTDVISEQNGRSRYAVVPSKLTVRLQAVPGKNEYYTAADDRNLADSFGIINENSIEGRIEGILLSPSRKKILILSY